MEDKFISSPNLGRKTSGKQISSVPYEISSVSHQFVSKRLNLEEEEDELVQVEKVAKSSKILKVGCLEENTVLISNAGEVFITGSGKHGQLGISYEANEEEIEEENKQSEDEDLEISKFTLITRLSSVFNIKISSMACGYYHIIAIKNDGGLLSWGLNTSGQLGLGNFIPKHSIPMPIDSLQNSRAIMAAAGEAHSLVLVEENDERVLYAFGSAENGKLGIGSVKSSTLVTTPQAIASLLDVKHISCGENHSAAITNSKNLYLWGEGWKGQLGHGNRDSQYEPKVLSGTMD